MNWQTIEKEELKEYLKKEYDIDYSYVVRRIVRHNISAVEVMLKIILAKKLENIRNSKNVMINL